MGLDFARQLLKRLQTVSANKEHSVDGSEVEPAADTENDMATSVNVSADGQSNHRDSAKPEVPTHLKSATVRDGQIVSGLPPAETETQVAQHIELLFGLVSKAPELLDR